MRVKICGIRRVEDADLAADLGATAIGIIFWPGSRRFLEPAAARDIVRTLPPFVTVVGVFVDQAVEYVRTLVESLKLGAVQLHGTEPVEPYRILGVPIIKAVPVADAFAPETISFSADAATVLLDAHDPVQRGGTGRTIDWHAAAALASMRRTILSGGLTPANVLAAISTVRPYAIDVSSGVESAPGVKDPEKLRALFEALREETR